MSARRTIEPLEEGSDRPRPNIARTLAKPCIRTTSNSAILEGIFGPLPNYLHRQYGEFGTAGFDTGEGDNFPFLMSHLFLGSPPGSLIGIPWLFGQTFLGEGGKALLLPLLRLLNLRSSHRQLCKYFREPVTTWTLTTTKAAPVRCPFPGNFTVIHSAGLSNYILHRRLRFWSKIPLDHPLEGCIAMCRKVLP